MNVYDREIGQLVEVYKSGNIKNIFGNKFANIVINGDKVAGINEINGIKIKAKHIKDGVSVVVSIDKNTTIENPVHLCFGMTPAEGKQIIHTEFIIGENSNVGFLAHCIFPNAKHIEHFMRAKVHLKSGAKMQYSEEHFHSETGGISVVPRLTAYLSENSKLIEEFKLLNGRAGNIDIRYVTEQEKGSSCQLLTKIRGKKDDSITVDETVNLNGAYSSGILKSRIVLLDKARGFINSKITAKAAYTRGHVDCEEIVGGDNVIASSIPQIQVMHPLAKVTHEASIGRIDKKKLETLMARGMEEAKAIDMVINGLMG